MEIHSIDIKNAEKLYDKTFRKNLRKNPKLYAREVIKNLAEDIEVMVVSNTKNIIYVVFLKNDLLPLEVEKLTAAGDNPKIAGSMFCASSLGSLSTETSTTSSFSSIGSTGSFNPEAD